MLVFATLCSFACICTYASAECQIADHKGNFHQQSRLRKTLFRDYNHKLPAVVISFNSTDESYPKYEVLLTLQYIKLTSMLPCNCIDMILPTRQALRSIACRSSCISNEPEQKAEFITQYTMNWRDERLEWNPKDYCGMDHIYVSSSDVWFPDITFVNAHSSADYRNDQHKFVRLNSSGHVQFDVDTNTDTTCETETQNFPFDRQRCGINIKSALFFSHEYGIKCALSPRLYNVVGFDRMNILYVWMRRRPSFYITMVIIPSFVINILSTMGILAKAADIMGKLGMALTSIMSLSFILGILATSLPRSDRLPKIVIYVMANLLIVVVALTVALALPHFEKIGLHICEGNESDNRKLDKRYRKVVYLLIAVFEIANLINLIALIV